MKHTVKYLLIQVEMIAMIISIILGTGAAESSMWGCAYALIFGPFVWGWLTNFEKQMHFLEVYDRAVSISLKSNK